MLVKTIILFSFLAFFIGIAQTTGPIINMLLLMGMNYKAKVSIALTFLFLAGGSLASIYKVSQRRNPQTGKTNVKLDLILITLPCLSSGALFGSVFKNFFSEIMITFMFIFLFLYLIYDYCQALKQKRQAPPNVQKPKTLLELDQLSKPLTETLIKEPPALDQSKTVIQYNEKPSTRNKLRHVVILTICYFLFTLLTYLIRGGPRYKSIIGVDSCGLQGWIILCGHLLISIIATVLTAKSIVNQTKGLSQAQIKKHSIQVTHENVWYFLIAAFVTGFFSALLAIGATLIIVPVWMKLGVDRNFAANSTPVLICFSTSIAFCVAYFNHVVDEIPYYVLIFYFVFSFICSSVVRDILVIITVKYRLEQMVIYLLLFVVVVTLIALIPFQITRLLKDYRRIIQLGTLC